VFLVGNGGAYDPASLTPPLTKMRLSLRPFTHVLTKTAAWRPAIHAVDQLERREFFPARHLPAVHTGWTRYVLKPLRLLAENYHDYEMVSVLPLRRTVKHVSRANRDDNELFSLPRRTRKMMGAG